MEKVFHVGGTGFRQGFTQAGLHSNSRSRMAVVERVLEPGRFMVSLENGEKLEVRGGNSLKPGHKVQVLFEEGKPSVGETRSGVSGIPKETITQWTAWIPLAFGGKGSQAKLDVFSERKPGRGPSQRAFVAYFVFTVETEKNGRVQWNVHLKGRQISLQVFAPDSDVEGLRALIGEVERALEGKGFYLTGKAVLLDKPFRVPDGFRLNVTG
jgi:hypothetical protein